MWIQLQPILFASTSTLTFFKRGFASTNLMIANSMNETIFNLNASLKHRLHHIHILDGFPPSLHRVVIIVVVVVVVVVDGVSLSPLFFLSFFLNFYNTTLLSLSLSASRYIVWEIKKLRNYTVRLAENDLTDL